MKNYSIVFNPNLVGKISVLDKSLQANQNTPNYNDSPVSPLVVINSYKSPRPYAASFPQLSHLGRSKFLGLLKNSNLVTEKTIQTLTPFMCRQNEDNYYSRNRPLKEQKNSNFSSSYLNLQHSQRMFSESPMNANGYNQKATIPTIIGLDYSSTMPPERENFSFFKMNSFGKNIKNEYTANSIKFQSGSGSYRKKKIYLRHCESIIGNQLESKIQTKFLSVINGLSSASALGFLIKQKLEKGLRFPRIRREVFDQLRKFPRIEGIRISCSGSLKGGLMARTYTYKIGPTSLHGLSKKIDYSYFRALTRYGTLGVKVWISYI